MTVRAFLVIVLVASASPTRAATAAANPPPAAVSRGGGHLDLATARVVDLSHAYGKDTLFWPTKPPQTFDLQVLSHGLTPGGFFYAANRFCAPEHGGTHMDAPLHFADGKWSAAEVPLDRLVAPAVVIDVRGEAAADRDYRLRPEDVTAWEARHGKVPGGSIVLLRTGWSDRWPDFVRYFGAPVGAAATELHFPSFGAAAVELLIARGVAAIGVDTASIDHGPSRDFPVHRMAAAANLPGLENLDHLDQLPETGAWLVALPMKIEEGTGGPLRAVALLP